MSYEGKFRQKERELIAANKYEHDEAIDILSKVVAEADEEISMLRISTITFGVTLIVLATSFLNLNA